MTANTNPSPNSFTFYMGFLSINNWNAANIAVNGKMPFSVSQKGDRISKNFTHFTPYI